MTGVNMRVEATLLKEKESVEYGYNKYDMKSIAGQFGGKHVVSEPRSESLKNVVGIVEDSWYEDGTGIVIESYIYDENIADGIDEGLCSIAPTLIVDPGSGNILDADSVFVTSYPDEIVGEGELVE